jgi:hypothetical protein
MTPDLHDPSPVLRERTLGPTSGEPDLDHGFIKPDWRRAGRPVQGTEPLVMPPDFHVMRPLVPGGTGLTSYDDAGCIETWHAQASNEPSSLV